MKKPSDEIINNVLHGLANGEEASLVAKWFATDEGQEYLSGQMDDYFESMKDGFEEIRVSHPVPSEKMWKKIENRTFYKIKSHFVLKVAAVLIPILFVAGLAWQVSNKDSVSKIEEYAEIYVPKGENTKIVLSDGTQVYLNADSKLRYPEKFTASSRMVILDGEGYFDVVKDKKHPFIVELPNDASIEVLGTAFNVEAYSNDNVINVALDKGKINLVSAGNERHELLPCEKLVYKRDTEEVFVSKNQNTESESQWRKGYIVFNNTELSEVIKLLNRWYDVEFDVKDKDALNYSYTITSKKVPLKELLSDFEKISPIKFTFENDTVRVRMK